MGRGHWKTIKVYYDDGASDFLNFCDRIDIYEGGYRVLRWGNEWITHFSPRIVRAEIGVHRG